MDTLSIFYGTNAVAVLISWLLAVPIMMVAIRYRKNPLSVCCRIYPFALSLLAAYKFSTCFLVSDAGVEIFSSQSLTLLSACFCVFAMAACTFLGRRHYRLFANWVLLLFPAVFFFIVNQLMMHFGLYRPIYTFGEIIEFRRAMPIFFFARLTFLSVLGLSVFFALFMVTDALMFDRWRLANRPSSDNTFPHKISVQITLYWTFLLLFGYVPLFFGSLWLHILFNLFYVIILVLSAYVCQSGTSEVKAQIAGEDASVLIGQRLPRLLDMEGGGTTPWGVIVKRNPFFSGNPLLDEVAWALGVANADVQQYVAARGCNLVAWVSEQRMLHCAQQVAETDRKIVEIAVACGYNDLPSFTRAFKRQFGTTPSEYRNKAEEKIPITPEKTSL